jgi:restriction system protein
MQARRAAGAGVDARAGSRHELFLPMRRLMQLLAASTNPPKTPDFLRPLLHGLVHGLITVWPLWLLIAVAAVGKLAWEMLEQQRLARSGIQEIDEMSGFTFEEYLRTLFQRLGYQVELTRKRGDYGADLVITKQGRRTVVQAKRWSKRVGVKAVQEVVAAKAIYRCDLMLVVANREFTQQARRLARANQVELWDRSQLVEKLLRGRGDEARTAQQHVPATATTLTTTATTTASATALLSSAATTATCVTCGVTVSEKVRDYCIQHSIRFEGRIYCFQHQRGVRAVSAAD